MENESATERRSFLTGLKAGAAAVAALALGSAARAQTPGRWEPARHDKDDWLDQIPGKHRLVFDTTTPDGLGLALAFAGNYIRVNRTDYGLQNNESAVLIVVRHRSVAFGYNDAIWAKYGAAISKFAAFEDPKSKAAPKINVYNSADYGDLIPTRGTTFDSLAKIGVHFGVCTVATRGVAAAIAGTTGDAEAIYRELSSNLISNNARMVPAGIVAVSRAQERGYTFVSA